MRKLLSLAAMLVLAISIAACDNIPLNTNQTTNNDSQTRVLTLEELSQYTGLNGTDAYIAVDGVVYDVTNVFVNGQHQGMQLGGTDATTVFAASPHSASLLETLPVVGVIGTVSFNPTSLETVTTTQSATNLNTVPETTTTTQPTSTTSETLPVFTLEQLSQYTGANGSTAYIAVSGVVYNVTNVFTNGTHQGMQLGGTDATSVFASSPHSAATLASLVIVGTLEGFPTIAVNSGITTTSGSTTTQYYDDDDDDDDDEHEDEDEFEDEFEDD